jgi:hypothetical protein
MKRGTSARLPANDPKKRRGTGAHPGSAQKQTGAILDRAGFRA